MPLKFANLILPKMNYKVLEWIGVLMCFAAIPIMFLTEFNGLFLIFAALMIANKTNKTLNFFATHPILKWWILLSMSIASLMDLVLAVKMLAR